MRLDLGYGGTDFHGWAAQPGLRTVQGELEAALATVLPADRAGVSVTVGGRTDAGVVWTQRSDRPSREAEGAAQKAREENLRAGFKRLDDKLNDMGI